MHKQIQQMAKGTFEYTKPFVSISAERIEIEVSEGKDFTGDFVITSENHVPMRGLVYSTNPRMECLTPQFEGEEVRIHYQFHSFGLMEGDIQKGEFCIVVNQGEYNLSFVASVFRLYADSSIGKIKTLDEFGKLAKENFHEAYRLFYSPNFTNLMRADQATEVLLYKGLRQGTPSGQKVEEFLVSIDRKKEVTLSFSAESAEFFGVTQPRRENIEIVRDQPGYVDVSVTSDAEFLVPEKKRLTDEDFVGSTLSFAYYMDERAMHAGKNYGQLCFELPGETVRFSVCASREEKKETEQKSVHRTIQESRAALMRLYINYRLKRIVTGVWANQSGAILDRLAALCPKDPMYKLMKVQTLLTNRQRQDALWILDQFKREYTKRTTSVWGYYLYLTTLIEREPSYVDSVTEEIEQIFHRRPDSARLFWITLFLKEDYYRNPAARFAAIKQWMKKDKSPYFYLEAYYMLWQEPYILTKLDRFEIEVLNWAVKWGALTKDIAKQVMDLIPAKKECDRFLYRILEACYQVNPTDEMLAVICSCLIRSQCFGREYHKWYELGIKYKLRMTGLYEAYLTSLDSRTFTEVPKMIQMYFQYDSGLAYQQKAVLYANIIAAEDTQSEVYQKYRSTMEDFCMQQIAEGHINDNLALIYKKLLPAELPDRETAQKLSAVLFTHRFHCTDRRAAKLFVLERWKDKPQEIFVKGGTAYFTAVTKNYCLIIEDAYGNRYGKSVEYCDEALMNPDRYIKSARALAGDELIYQIYDLDQKMASGRFLPGDIRSVQNLMESDAVSDRFKEELTLKMIDCCKEEKVGSGILEVCSGNFSREAERVLLDYLVEEQWYDRAYALAEECGYDYLKEKHLTALCSYAIEHAEFEEDDFLTGFAETAFVRGAYNDVILKYLSRCYSGATKTMAKLWEAAHEAASIDTTDLEERIITQMLYSTDYIAQIDQIFEHYAAVGSKEICMAYLSYFADAYLFLDMVVPDHVFLRIWKYYRAGTPLNDACKIGLMKYFAVKDGLTGPEYDTADELLYLYTGRNLWFSFYSSFEKRLRVKYHLYDKFFVSYHARGAQRIRIRYSMDGENYREETMTEMYHGIYVKQFVLFFGESVQYYITEESSGQEKVTESASLKPRNPAEKDGRGRYGKLNEILTVRALDEPETLEQKMKQYYRMEKMTEELFQLL